MSARLLEATAHVAALSEGELVRLSGGTTTGGPLGKAIEVFLSETVKCLISDWNNIVDCFNEGRQSAQG